MLWSFMGLRVCAAGGLQVDRSIGSPIVAKPVFLFIITHSTLNDPAARQALGNSAPPLGSRPPPPPHQRRYERRATKMSSENKEAAAPKRVESDVYDRQIRLWGADAQVRTTFSCDLLGFLFRSAACCTTLIFVGWEWRNTCKLLRGPSTIHIHRVIVMSPPTHNPLPAACNGVRSCPLREFERCVLGDSKKFGPRRHSRRHL